MHYRIDRDTTGKLSIPDGKKFDTLWQVNTIIVIFLVVFIFHDLFQDFLIILNLSRFNLLMVLCLCSILFANVIPLHNYLNAISKPCPYYKEYTVYPVEKYQLPLFYYYLCLEINHLLFSMECPAKEVYRLQMNWSLITMMDSIAL